MENQTRNTNHHDTDDSKHLAPIIETETTYLVPSEDLFADPVPVEKVNGNGGLACKCLEAITNLQEPCKHIRAVQTFQEDKHEPLNQTKIDGLLWIVRKLESQMAENESSAQAQLDQIALWLETANGKLDRQRRHLLNQCRQWLEVSGRRSASLVNGVIKLRKRPDKLEILDRDQVLSNSRFQRVIPAKVEIDKKAIRDHVKATGEIPEGVDLVPQTDQFSATCYKPERS